MGSRALHRRNPESDRAAELERLGCELRVADLTRPAGIAEALDGVDIAYFLVHMISDDGELSGRRARGAGRFARPPKKAGVQRMIYLGGLGDESTSKHLAPAGTSPSDSRTRGRP